MKILIVSFWFPPSNRIGAIRVGKLARYLDLRGHQTRVLTTDVIEDRSLPLEIPREHVYAEYRRRVDWLDPVARLFRRQPSTGTSASREILEVGAQSSGRSAWDWLQLQYYGLIHIPDERADWIKIAVPAGRRLIEEWRPDIIFASGPPFTGLFVAGRLGRAFNIPWVADFRDLWVDNPYYGDSEPRWRRPVDIMLERLMVRNAAALVTVSPNWAQQLYRRHRKAVEVVYNGYAKEDFPEPSVREDQGDLLTIRYTGSIYPGFRDPSPVFAAIGLLEDAFRNRVMVEFFGRSAETVLALAAQHRVRDRVAAWSPVPYRRALELQMEADILLLLQWRNKRDEGNLPGKIFEYLHARRPILLVGYEQGIAASLIRERNAGLVSSTPERIRDQLQAWLEDKRAGRLKRLDSSVSRGLSRDDQFLKLEQLFAKIVNERGVTTTATTPTIAWGGVDKSCQRMRHRRSRFPGSDEPSGGGGSTDS